MTKATMVNICKNNKYNTEQKFGIQIMTNYTITKLFKLISDSNCSFIYFMSILISINSIERAQ